MSTHLKTQPKRDPMIMNILLGFWQRYINAHPASIGETYLQHLMFTLMVAFTLLKCAVILCVHGLFPFIWTDKGSQLLMALFKKIQQRKTQSCQENEYHI